MHLDLHRLAGVTSFTVSSHSEQQAVPAETARRSTLPSDGGDGHNRAACGKLVARSTRTWPGGNRLPAANIFRGHHE